LCIYECCVVFPFSLLLLLFFLSLHVMSIQNISSFARDNHWNSPFIFVILLSLYCAVGKENITSFSFLSRESTHSTFYLYRCFLSLSLFFSSGCWVCVYIQGKKFF
jgi:hypothetical protein